METDTIYGTTGGLRVALFNTREGGAEAWRGTFADFITAHGMAPAEVREAVADLSAGRDYAFDFGMRLRRVDSLALAENVLRSRATSAWLQSALASALRRDPVDAVNDAELLLSILSARLEEVQGGAR